MLNLIFSLNITRKKCLNARCSTQRDGQFDRKYTLYTINQIQTINGYTKVVALDLSMAITV